MLLNRFSLLATLGAVTGLMIALAGPLASTAQAQAAQTQEDANFCAALLTAHPQGGEALTTEVKNLVAAAPDAAADIVGCTGQANKAQTQAIGRGLAQVVASIKNTNPQLADQIAELVADSGNKVLQTAYQGGTGEPATAATPGTEGGAGTPPGAGTTPVTFAPTSAPVPILTVTPGGGGTGGGTISGN